MKSTMKGACLPITIETHTQTPVTTMVGIVERPLEFGDRGSYTTAIRPGREPMSYDPFEAQWVN